MNTSINQPLWKRILILFACSILSYFVFIVLGQALGYFVTTTLGSSLILNDTTGVLAESFVYFIFIGIWIITILALFLIKPFRPILKTLGKSFRGNNWKMLLFGILLGLGMNSLCAFAAMLNKDIHVTFSQFHILPLLFIFFCVFIQSSAEELVCRGFIFQITAKYFRNPIVIILFNSVIFSAGHLFNSGINITAIISLVISGVLFSLLVYYFDSIWIAFTAHTAWNFSQAFIWGLPNSGITSSYSIFELDTANARNSFFYNTGFGIEGTWFAIIVMIAVCAIVAYIGIKQNKKPTNIWES